MKLNIGNLSSGLQLYYKMDGSLGYAKDYSPYRRDASIWGTIEQDASGIIGTGFKWPAVANNSYLRTPAFSLGESQLSINFWSVPTDDTVLHPIIGDVHQNGTSGYIYAYTNYVYSGSLAFEFADGSIPKPLTINSFYTGFFNQWVMTTITADYAHRTVSFFRNGVLFRKSQVTNNMLFPSSSRVKYIGTYCDTYFANFNSNMDEFGLWNRVLSQSEITQLYNNSAGKSYPFPNTVNSAPAVKLSKDSTAQLKLVDPLLDRIQAYYPLNDSSNNIIDVTGNGRNGVNDGATPLQPGKMGTCYYFNDANFDEILFNTKGITTQTGISFACWFNWGGDNTHINSFFVVNWQAPAVPFHWLFYNSYGINWQSSDANTRRHIFFATPHSLPINIWTHLAATHNYKLGTVTFYINGSALTPLINSAAKPFPCNNYIPYRIGSYATTVHPFDGYLDEVGIWAKALTSDDVSRLYNNGIGLTYPFR
jgi:hypothetical protein